MSSVIKYFLNPHPEDVNAKNLAEHLQNEFHELKKHFMPIIYEQDKVDPNDPNFENIRSELNRTLNYILGYIYIDLRSIETCSHSGMPIPDFSSLIPPREQWPIDEYEVNEEEYKNIKLPNILKAESEENTNDKQKPKPYGPKGFPTRIKFSADLTKCVNEIFKSKQIPIHYEYTREEKITDEIAANLASTFLNLRISMASFLQKHSGDANFKTIVSASSKQSLQLHLIGKMKCLTHYINL